MNYMDVAKIIAKAFDSNPDLSVLQQTRIIAGPESALFQASASDGTHYTIIVNQLTLDNPTDTGYLGAIKNLLEKYDNGN